MSIPKSGSRGKPPTDELPEVVELFEQLAKLKPLSVEFDSAIFRSIGTRYASDGELLSGRGAAIYGGRWNRPGILAVYASLDVITATYEAYQNFMATGFSPANIRPRVMAGAEARLSVVCNLASSAVRRKLGFSLKDLLEEDWQAIQASGEESWTQAIGRGCREVGFEGLIVPSAARPKGKNLVLFPDRLYAGSRLSPIAAEDLPPHPADWPG